MTRLTDILCSYKPLFGHNKMYKNNRRPFNPESMKVVFHETAPMKCRNFVRGDRRLKGESPCIPEMIKLMNCMRNVEYIDGECPDEVSLFKQCYKNAAQQSLSTKKTLDMADAKQLTSLQVNILLKKYPQHFDA